MENLLKKVFNRFILLSLQSGSPVLSKSKIFIFFRSSKIATCILGIDLKPKDKPEMKKPSKGKKKWKQLPEIIDIVIFSFYFN